MASKFDDILGIQFSAEKIAQAANCAYWLRSYNHEGENYQRQIIREEYAKLSKAFAVLQAPENPVEAEARAAALTDLAALDAELL